MKIGIFGDSFAESDNDESVHGWAWHVSKNLPKAHIDNYGEGGSSLYFTYSKFLKEHTKYDRVIVFGTNGGRLYFPDMPTHWRLTHISGSGHFEEGSKSWLRWQETDVSPTNKWFTEARARDSIEVIDAGGDGSLTDDCHIPDEIREAITLYYKHIVNYDEQDKMRELIITDMQKLRPDMLYFDCFYETTQFSKHLPIVEISTLDLPESFGQGSFIDNRQNHMNAENNRIFGEKVTNWINTSQFEMDITEFSKED
jgi:hypothetical protein